MPAHKVFTLAAPITLEGRQPLQQVTCQKPRWKHIKRLMAGMTGEIEGQDLRSSEERRKDQEQDMEAISELLCSLCSLQAEEMDEMELEDVMTIFEWVEGFAKKFQKTGATS